ncbi:enoyl-CoA hydratase/isomerase family protein [bacterium]|nr:enoyl-CoA hydratase/isomerase family protein [bacterium]QQR56867.1 MAG: enoyl-CoA hydratase/isomerase family protein [Candidatus Melainabacteria bacterium]
MSLANHYLSTHLEDAPAPGGENAIGRLTISREERRNAISTSMWSAIPEYLTELKEKGARVMVLTGSNSCFASGADIEDLKIIADLKGATKFWHAIRDCLQFIYTFPLPVIAMIDGPCIGGGCLLATACDFRIASNNSVFGIPIAKLGIVLDDASVLRLVHLIGPAQASLMLYTGNVVDAARALQLGLINEVLSEDKLESGVKEICNTIASNAYGSIFESKRSIRRACTAGHEDLSDLLPQHESVVLASYLTSDFKQRVGIR